MQQSVTTTFTNTTEGVAVGVRVLVGVKVGVTVIVGVGVGVIGILLAQSVQLEYRLISVAFVV